MTYRAALSKEPPYKRPPGTWKPIEEMESPGLESAPTATFACPKCGVVGTLDEHEIRGDGTVTPSVVCPNDCGFHDMVVLEGWPGRNGVDNVRI